MGEDLRTYRAHTEPRCSLVCFPPAGGNATTFRDWPAHLPDDIGVFAARYPGRLDRFREPPPATVADLVAPAARAVGSLPGPTVLFGHSMGAVIAHEVTIALEAADKPPRLLVVSGREAPHLARPTTEPDDESLLAMCRALGGVSEDALADEEMRDLILGPLRVDSRMLRAHRTVPVVQVRTPILAYLGIDDPGCTEPEIAGWEATTTGGFQLRVLPGDHTSLITEPGVLLTDLTRTLTAAHL